MYFYIFLFFCIPDFYVYGESEYTSGPKVVEARIRSKHWKLLEEEEDTNSLDVFSKKIVKPGIWNVTFLAWPDTIDTLNKHGIEFKTIIKNVHQYFQQHRNATINRRAGLVNKHITFTHFLTFEEIEDFVRNIAPSINTQHKKVTTVTIGKTVQKRDILMVKIIHKGAKDIMFIDAGIHAREWLSIMTALRLLTRVLYAGEDSVVSNMNWYIVPTLNPDGYVRSHMEIHRLHRKNMNKKNCSNDCRSCGVDLNRNFGVEWGASGTSRNPCSETYGGTHAFSEPESRALRDILQKEKKNIKLYLSLHSYGFVFLYPWGYKAQRVLDWEDLEYAAKVATKRISWVTKRNTKYAVKNTGKEFYPASGGADDYAKLIGIKYSFTLEVQKGGLHGFDPSSDDIEDYTSENAEGIIAMTNYINNFYNKKKRSNYAKGKAANSTMHFYLMLFYIIKRLCIFVNKCF